MEARSPASVTIRRQWPDWGRVAVLLLVATVLHSWVIAHTTVTSRDSIGFIRYALWLEQQPWREALPKIQQHPLYPLSVLVVSWPVRQLFGTSPQTMQLASQLASAIVAVLLVIPMYFLGRQLFDRRVGFWGALLCQCLPVVAQVTSDGISDGIYLLLITTAILLAGQALRSRSAWQFAGCGLAIGLAYLTRPEGLLLAGAVLLVLMGTQIVGRRWPLGRSLGGALALASVTALVAVPYMAVIRGLTNKPGALKLIWNEVPLDTLGQPEHGEQRPPAREQAAAACAPPLAALPLAVWWNDQKRAGAPPWEWAVKAVFLETIHASHYLAWLPALLGMWWFRQRLRSSPLAWVMLIFCAGTALLLVRVILGIHYLSERHTLVAVLCGSPWAAAALIRIGDRLLERIEMGRARPLPPYWRMSLPFAWLLLCTTWCLPQTLKPLHANRAGHRAAGAWLADHMAAGDRLTDPFCWAHYYAGCVLREAEPSVVPGPSSIRYVVLAKSKNAHARLLGLPQAQTLAAQGKVVFRWTPTRREQRRYRAEEVEIIAVPCNAAPLLQPSGGGTAIQ